MIANLIKHLSLQVSGSINIIYYLLLVIFLVWYVSRNVINDEQYKKQTSFLVKLLPLFG